MHSRTRGVYPRRTTYYQRHTISGKFYRPQNHRRGLSVDEILREFPHLTPAQVYDALSFYYDHRIQIDQEISELTDPRQMAHQYPPTLQLYDATS